MNPVQNGDSEFGSELAQLQTQKVRFLQSRGMDLHTAEDVVSRATLKLLPVKHPIEHLAAFFHKIVERERIDLIRRLNRERRYAPLFDQTEEDQEHPHTWSDYEAMMDVLRSLKGVSTLGLALAERRWVFGWTTEDLMAATGLSRDAIDQHISRVRRAARKAAESGGH